jgi:DNA ligase-associated metallophosphoesterase
MAIEIRIKDNHLLLLHQKAVYWMEAQTLLVADLHIGKVMHFRRHGIAVPDAAIAANFARLDELIDRCRPERIIFLGDLFHNRINAEWAFFTEWRNRYPSIGMLIVPGNHDILPHYLFTENNIRVVTGDYYEGPFLFTHHPKSATDESVFIFAGHIHPVFSLKAKGRQSFRLPCFVHDPGQMILPSFGVFTGGYDVSDLPHLNVYLVAETRVFALV